MRFTKMHGAGNDYVYVDCFDEPMPARPGRTGPAGLRPAFRRRRRRADPDLPLRRGRRPDADVQRRRLRGRDVRQRRPLRGQVRLRPRHRAATTTLRIETGRGVLTLDLEVGRRPGRPRPRRHGRADPRAGRDPDHAAGQPGWPAVPWSTSSWTSAAGRFAVTCVSMGNPHCVTFVDQLDRRLGAGRRAAGRERSAFSQAGQRRVRRGALAGRGAHAGVGARLGRDAGLRHRGLRRLRGRRARPAAPAGKILAHLPGGDLELDWADDNHVYMTGPAVEVFQRRVERDVAAERAGMKP